MYKIKRTLLYVSMLMICATLGLKGQAMEKTVDYEKPNDIVIVLDVSGSMATTDEERLAFETIELLWEICDADDRIGVVAFNEEIVYRSRLVELWDKSEVNKIRKDLEQIEYHGDTDNGLGLRTGLELLEETQANERNQAIIFVSDGKIDLPYPIDGRTEETSKQEMEESLQAAIERRIPIYTLGFSNSEAEIIDELTAIATATQGSGYLCKGTLQMMNHVLDIAMQYKDEYIGEKITVKADKELQRYETELDEKSRVCIIFQSSEPLEDFEVIAPGMMYEITQTKHCKVISFDEKQEGKVTLCYSAEKECNAIISDLHFLCKEESEPMKEETVMIPEAEELTQVMEPEPEEENTMEIWMAIMVIIVVTICVCVGIIYRFFHKPPKAEKQSALEGYLYACFIDLKSKNDIPATVWDLKDYPPEGVTLKELFQGNKIDEDLPQLEQICLYPDEDGSGLILVHCTDGGIFIDDKTVTQNVPAHVHYGETIYVGFPENASEFSLKYQEKKEENERCM